MDTGRAPIVYLSAWDVYWGQKEGDGEGENPFGKTLVLVREWLRTEGYSRTR
jgi:predicted NAD-dependent protein-ADP-ribosyltransferase YbiA (DUF1768 family)